jgi:AraC family transcriptional regulator of adaptative response / DNA-3-methyladenine glycosylase II
MAEVARAAGFGDTMRLTETFEQLYHRPPDVLRTSSDPNPDSDAVALNLSYRPPYDWRAMIGFLRARAIPGLEVVTDESYERTIEIGGAHGIVSVRPTQGNALRTTIRVRDVSIFPRVIYRTRHVFDLATDPEVIETYLALDQQLAPVIARRPGLRVPGAWDGFELAVRAILGQQITVAGAIQLAGRLVKQYGERLDPQLPAADGLTHVFPRAAAVANQDLSCLDMPTARRRALSAFAGIIARDDSIFSPGGTFEAAVARLRTLPGVGEWTAHYIAMRELREPDAFPAADIGLMRALADTSGRRPSARELLARAERWRPWRAYAAQHLWSSHVPAMSRSKSRGKQGQVGV